VAFPICIIGVGCAWGLLMVIIRPDDVKQIPPIVYDDKQPLRVADAAIIVLCVSVIAQWSLFSFLKPLYGALGIISLAFMSIVFGSGILTEVDLNSLNWHTLALLGGSNVLGKAIESSNLLEHVSNNTLGLLPTEDHALLCLYVFVFLVVISGFISHTVAAVVFMPLILEMAHKIDELPLLGLGSVLAISGSMSLPFSSFPNLAVKHVVDDFHRPFLTTTDYIKPGVMLSLLSIVLIMTLGSFLIPMVDIHATHHHEGSNDD